MDAASSSTASAQGPQKRVLPSRSRRGGPGVGTCDVDVMVLEMYKRKLESEPLIPADTPFLLTTNSSKFSGDSEKNPETAIIINTVANDRYFDRPEVLKAFRDQEIIQTPDFEAINESSTVGGRFRPRGAEDESAETSDAAYEKRHKKFETFEKRQRLREKEKLKHEHYKLKERIEQLRAMDSSAFMAVHASSFSDPPPHQATEVDETGSQAQANGTAQHAEGERRRKEMLDNALGLEKRYSYLLPPDRVRKPQDTAEKAQIDGRDEEESDTEKISQVAGPSRKETESIKFKIPARSSASATPAPSPATTTAKPSISKKPRAVHAGSFRPVQTSASYAAAQDRIPSTSNSFVDVEMQTPEPGRSTPPLLSPSNVIPIEFLTPASFAVSVSSKAPSTRANGRKRGQANGFATPNPTNGAQTKSLKKHAKEAAPEVIANEDGESEKALSEDEDTQPAQSGPVISDGVSKPADDATEPAESEVDVTMHGQDEVSPEVREISTRMEQTGLVGPGAGHRLPSQDLVHEPAVAQVAAHVDDAPVEESISTRPAKRPRKTTAKVRAQSIAGLSDARTPSIGPGVESTTTRPYRKSLGPRGTQTQTYTSSTTGEEIRTNSLLIMAALRRESAKRSFEKRHNTSFGIVTPGFKENHEFEIPEWLHYPDEDLSRLPIAAPEPEPAEAAQEDVAPAAADEPTDTVDGHDTDRPEDTEPAESVAVDEEEMAEEEEGALTEPDVDVEDVEEDVEAEKSSKLAQAVEEAADSDTTEPMEIDEPEPVQDVPTTEASTEHDTEATEETREDEVELPEPGVGIRVLSLPRDEDDEEQLEW